MEVETIWSRTWDRLPAYKFFYNNAAHRVFKAHKLPLFID